MSKQNMATGSLIFYTGKNYAGTAQQVAHGDSGELAFQTNAWDYQSVAMSGMQTLVFSRVNPADSTQNYLGHSENVVTVQQDDLTLLYPSSTQFPLEYLGLDPAIAAIVWLQIDPAQAAPDAVASTAQVGGSTTNISTLSLPGRNGVLGIVARTEGSSVVASCPYGDYNTADGTVNWTGTGSVVLEYSGGQVIVVATTNFPEGWTLSEPLLQPDGSWIIKLDSGEPSSNTISHIDANPDTIADDGLSSSIITATVINGNAQPVEGVMVEWVTTLGSLTSQSSVTNAKGEAVTALTCNGSTGTAVVSASIPGSAEAVNVTITAENDLFIANLTSDKDSILNNGSDAATLTATVCHASGGLAEGVAVYWTTSRGDINHNEQDSDAAGESNAKLTDNGDTGIAVVTAALENGISLAYSVELTSDESAFIVRGSRSNYKASGQLSHGRLVALDAVTLQPVNVNWQYDNGIAGGVGSDFLDTQPQETLIVTLPGNISLSLNPANILGNGEWTDISTSAGAFVARLNDETCVGWGVSSYGGMTPDLTLNFNIASFSATFYAFTALRKNQSIFAWGLPTEGGEIPSGLLSLSNVNEVRGSRGTFALRCSSYPYIQSWGWGTEGGDEINMSVPSYIAAMNNINKIIANDNAFVVINTSGQVYAWGDADAGGETSPTVSTLYSVTDCCASRLAFSVISNGKIYSWGDADYGGLDGTVSGINDALRMVSTESAFVAMRANGGIVCWGNEEYGNSLPAQYLSRTDIVDVKASYGAFCALCRDGSVFSWGNSNYGGDSSSVSSQLKNIVALSATSGSFAALTDRGNVVVWGDASTGGNNTAVSSELYDICAIYSNSHAFTALREDNHVVSWGDPNSGPGNIPSILQGNISYLKK